MIKEYSIDFNEQKIEFNMYRDHIGDKSYPSMLMKYADIQTGDKIPIWQMIILFENDKKRYENEVKKYVKEEEDKNKDRMGKKKTNGN